MDGKANPVYPSSKVGSLDGVSQGSELYVREKCSTRSQNKTTKAALGNSTNTAATTINNTAAPTTKSQLYSLLDTAQEYLKPLKHRTCGCSRYVSNFNNPNYEVPVVSDGKKHSFKNLTVCGSVWACPVCSYKIQSVRSQQLIEAMGVNRRLGGSTVFVTYTFPHTRYDVLQDLMLKFAKGLRSLKGRRAFKDVMISLGIHSKVRSLEVTWGNASGWHPHSHEVYFSDRVLTVNQVKELDSVVFEQWRKACISVGLGVPSREHGVKLEYLKSEKDDSKIGSYVCKFAHEVTMSANKVSKAGNRYTPFSMLQELREKYNNQLANKFREYVEAFHGRRQIFGLSELLKRFELNEVSEEEAARQGVIREEIDKLSIGEFNTIAYYKKQSAVIGIYDLLGKEAAREYISKLCKRRVIEYNAQSEKKRRLKKELKNQTYVAMIREGLSSYLPRSYKL